MTTQKYHFYENTQTVVDLSDGKVTPICSFKDCGIKQSPSMVLNDSPEMTARIALVVAYLEKVK